ncbi:MAG: bacillithiol system redox-active protein YtxJ [Candidatus Kapaibacterium sp.]|nr:MAG: bacillithiol system redox-active protein YtxJ [Candidatus Kapabacteria bacterium]
MHELRELPDLASALEAAQTGITLFFKHSATCDLSAAAWEEFLDFLRENTAPVTVYYCVVQDARPISNEIESRLGIRHESPQAIFLRNGMPYWNASHRRITTTALHEQAQAPIETGA